MRLGRLYMRVGVGLLATILAASACQILAGIDPVDKEPPAGPLDEGGGPAVEDQRSPNDPCAHVRPPPPPTTDDDRDGVVAPFYLAVRTFSLTEGGPAQYAGFDLDAVCTCDERPESFAAGASSCTPKREDCDFDGGVDNTTAKLLSDFAPAEFSIDEGGNDDISTGTRGLLLYVSKYNGKPNDSEVIVGAMLSHGILDGAGCGTTLSGKGRAPPGWCGKDRWSYPTAYVKPGTAEPVGGANGYVTGGVLVFQSDVPITMFLGGTTVSLASPLHAGRLEQKPDGSWKLTSVLGGRFHAPELLAAIGSLGDPTSSGAVCNAPFFPTVKSAVCGAVDISRSSRFDFKEGPCDAVSMAISFTAEEVAIGQKHDEPVDEDGPCAASKVPPGTYACP